MVDAQPEVGPDAGVPARRGCSRTSTFRGSRNRCIPDDIRSHRVAERGHLRSRSRWASTCTRRTRFSDYIEKRRSTCSRSTSAASVVNDAVARSRGAGECLQPPRESARRRPHAGPSAHRQGDPEPLAARSDPDLGARAVRAPGQARGRKCLTPTEPGASTDFTRERALAEFRISVSGAGAE